MSKDTTYVFLRLSAGVRHSQVDFEEIERLAGAVSIRPDARDTSVYCLVLPQEIDGAQANRIVSALVTTGYIDEAWQETAKLSAATAPRPESN